MSILNDVSNVCPKCGSSSGSIDELKYAGLWRPYIGNKPDDIEDEKVAHECCNCGVIVWTYKDRIPSNIEKNRKI